MRYPLIIGLAIASVTLLTGHVKADDRPFLSMLPHLITLASTVPANGDESATGSRLSRAPPGL